MKCEETKQFLSEYLDDELDPETRAAVMEHIASCEICRAELAGLQATVSLVRELPSETAPDQMRQKIAERIRLEAVPVRRPALIHRIWPLAAAATIALVIIIATPRPAKPVDYARGPAADKDGEAAWSRREALGPATAPTASASEYVPADKIDDERKDLARARPREEEGGWNTLGQTKKESIVTEGRDAEIVEDATSVAGADARVRESAKRPQAYMEVEEVEGLHGGEVTSKVYEDSDEKIKLNGSIAKAHDSYGSRNRLELSAEKRVKRVATSVPARASKYRGVADLKQLPQDIELNLLVGDLVKDGDVVVDTLLNHTDLFVWRFGESRIVTEVPASQFPLLLARLEGREELRRRVEFDFDASLSESAFAARGDLEEETMREKEAPAGSLAMRRSRPSPIASSRPWRPASGRPRRGRDVCSWSPTAPCGKT